jgi:hypothetical protein
VVTCAADRIPERISKLVHPDTGPIPAGTALIEMYPPEARRHIERQVEELGDGWRFPMPPPEELASMGNLERLDDDLLELLRSRTVPNLSVPTPSHGGWRILPEKSCPGSASCAVSPSVRCKG